MLLGENNIEISKQTQTTNICAFCVHVSTWQTETSYVVDHAPLFVPMALDTHTYTTLLEETMQSSMSGYNVQTAINLRV